MKRVKEDTKKRALIYARVSTGRQAKDGQGLDSQEYRCRNYAEQNGYTVEQIFPDSYTGGGDFMNRPAMAALLTYLDSKPFNKYLIIFDDLKRFARDVEFHRKLRTELKIRNADVYCLNFEFNDTPEGEFIETVLAAQNELERKQNRRQVIQKMKARLEAGYWCFNSSDVPGYHRVSKSRDWVLQRKEPEASIIAEALEGFASGRFQQQIDVARFLERKGFFGKKKRKEVYLSQVNRLLKRIEYAGYVEFLPWEVERRKAKHEGLITIGTYSRIQERLRGQRRIWLREDYSADFPLRPYVKCFYCDKQLTASWSKGRTNHYPYYRCSTKGCPQGNKSIPKDRIESDFKDLLSNLAPKEKLLELTKAILNDLYDKKHGEYKNKIKQVESRKREIKDEIDKLMSHIMRTANPVMVERYEEKVAELSAEAKAIDADVTGTQRFDVTFGTAIDEVFDVIKKPANKWDSEDLEDKRLVIKLVFDGKPAYDKNHGFGTAELSSVIRLFERIRVTNSQDVENFV